MKEGRCMREYSAPCREEEDQSRVNTTAFSVKLLKY